MKLTKGLKTGTRKKAATKAAPTKPAEQTAAARSSTNEPVLIEAKVDVGFGNALYLRGEGNGLSWNQGVPLTCIDSSTWKWSGAVSDKVRFKLLLNDAIWAAGDDLVAAPGQKLEVSPRF